MRFEDRAKLREQLMRHEGLRLRMYRDTVGKLTIGYGRNLEDRGISEHEAAYLLSGDIQDATLGLIGQYPWFLDLDPVRQAVLINMAFNMGLTTLAGFSRTLAAVARADYADAADRMLQSKWATQVGARAVELAEQMRSGAWPA